MVTTVFKPDFYIFSYNEQLKNNEQFHGQVFIVSYLLKKINKSPASILFEAFYFVNTFYHKLHLFEN